MNVDELEDIRWIRGLGGERLPTALFSQTQEKVYFFAIGEGSRFFAVRFLLTRRQMFLYQTPGRCPPRITGRVVNTVTRGWLGAPNDRAPFRIHDAVVGFVDRCLSRTRNLAASNETFG